MKTNPYAKAYYGSIKENESQKKDQAASAGLGILLGVGFLIFLPVIFSDGQTQKA